MKTFGFLDNHASDPPDPMQQIDKYQSQYRRKYVANDPNIPHK
jgi:hypothetical protein